MFSWAADATRVRVELDIGISDYYAADTFKEGIYLLDYEQKTCCAQRSR